MNEQRVDGDAVEAGEAGERIGPGGEAPRLGVLQGGPGNPDGRGCFDLTQAPRLAGVSKESGGEGDGFHEQKVTPNFLRCQEPRRRNLGGISAPKDLGSRRMEDFGRAVKLLREAHGWSQEDLVLEIVLRFGAEHKVSRGTIQNWERGKSPPKLDDAMRLAELLDVSLEALAYGRATDEAPPAAGAADGAPAERKAAALKRGREIAEKAAGRKARPSQPARGRQGGRGR